YNNKLYIGPHHTSTTKSRVLSEKDIQSSGYDKDVEMKSVKENFDRQSSKRFEKYEERMKEKRQKRKEERDKNIQEIVKKDKMEKHLAEKIEKGCLKCGCALGGGVLPVWGLVSGLWYGTWLQYLSEEALPAGIKAGLKEGLKQIKLITKIYRGTDEIPVITVDQMLSSGKFTNGVNLYDMVKHINNSLYNELGEGNFSQFWIQIDGMVNCETIDMFNTNNSTHIAAVAKAVEEGEALKVAEFAANTSLLSNTIIVSVVAILLIVLVMIIIYLVLRYRRKKKMKKKAEYTKLLNE
ncbi:rifin, partial [Plasmodium reichenowi]